MKNSRVARCHAPVDSPYSSWIRRRGTRVADNANYVEGAILLRCTGSGAPIPHRGCHSALRPTVRRSPFDLQLSLLSFPAGDRYLRQYARCAERGALGALSRCAATGPLGRTQLRSVLRGRWRPGDRRRWPGQRHGRYRARRGHRRRRGQVARSLQSPVEPRCDNPGRDVPDRRYRRAHAGRRPWHVDTPIWPDVRQPTCRRIRRRRWRCAHRERGRERRSLLGVTWRWWRQLRDRHGVHLPRPPIEPS